ncbi:MAG: cytochrome b/b6 domain-containing protein, partial [Rhizobiaceae bacterium]
MSAPTSPTTASTPSVPVWDLAVRLFHWSLVLAVATALGLGFLGPKRLLDWHVFAGYAAAALVIFRLVWGFAGTTFARFSAFPPSPAAVRAHLSGTHAAAYGHNPLGALMVYALLAIVLALAVTGLVALGGALRQGPLAALVAYADGRTAGEIHEWLGWGIAGLVALHIGGVLFESRRERENLARSMLTGRKRPRHDATPET